MELGLHSIANKVVFGRAPTCDVVLEHLSISRQHATLSTDTAGNLFITDLGSGAMLNCLQLPGLPLLEQLRVAEAMEHTGILHLEPPGTLPRPYPYARKGELRSAQFRALCHTMINAIDERALHVCMAAGDYSREAAWLELTVT